MALTVKEFTKLVDHSLLKPQLTEEEIIKGCELAKETGCISVCVQPVSIKLASEVLAGSDTLVGTVVGFPLGANTTETKVFEAEQAYALGAKELDMVLNIGALKSKQYNLVKKDIKAVVDATPAIVKVILETCYLTDEEIVTACKLCVEAGAHFVKTSTGFASAGATVEHIKLMRETVGPDIGVKAAGGISTLPQVEELIAAGANRLGISRTANIIKEIENRG